MSLPCRTSCRRRARRRRRCSRQRRQLADEARRGGVHHDIEALAVGSGRVARRAGLARRMASRAPRRARACGWRRRVPAGCARAATGSRRAPRRRRPASRMLRPRSPRRDCCSRSRTRPAPSVLSPKARVAIEPERVHRLERRARVRVLGRVVERLALERQRDVRAARRPPRGSGRPPQRKPSSGASSRS